MDSKASGYSFSLKTPNKFVDFICINQQIYRYRIA